MRSHSLILACSLCVSFLESLDAQELRIYTVTKAVGVKDGSADGGDAIVARSLTLFHAGKVYDYISTLQEVTIFEPAHRRFTILNESADAVAVVSQDEVRRFLALAEDQAQQLVRELASHPDPQQRRSVDLLQFQLQADFETVYEAGAHRLQLRAPRFAYDVECAQPPHPDTAEAYLRYADAIAELNSVLHPQSFLPAPRLALNRQLRERGLLPISVRRRVEVGTAVEMAAEHEWKWSLTELDRKYIDRWESQISKGYLRPLSFEQMQRAVLTGKVSQR